MSNSLTWSLGISTYQRLDMLMRSLPLSIGQTYPPMEIVIVDSSENWDENKKRVLEAFSNNEKNIPFYYIEARERSTPAQRNQVVKNCKGDILFLIDDDSLMFPNCAEEIMKVYQADVHNEVVGVAASSDPQPPDAVPSAAVKSVPFGSKGRDGFTKVIRKFLIADDINIPHDKEWPNFRVPKSVSHLDVYPNMGIAGCFMTVRRQIALDEPFEELLSGYAAGEDIDASSRWQRHGCNLRANDAYLHHVVSPSGRPALLYLAATQVLNRIVLNRLYGSVPELSKKRLKRLCFRLLIIQALKDLRDLNLAFPRVKGVVLASAKIDQIFGMNEQKLRSWYPQVHQELLDKFGNSS